LAARRGPAPARAGRRGRVAGGRRAVAVKYRDYYEVLGVPRTATADDIKRAYRKLARKHHPDLHTSGERDKAAERFKEINETYEVPSDAELPEPTRVPYAFVAGLRPRWRIDRRVPSLLACGSHLRWAPARRAPGGGSAG
jgi:hypothetical protein